MPVKQIHYEEVLAECSDYRGAIALLRQFRPYLELIPSMRRPQESVIPLPLPLIRLRNPVSAAATRQTDVASGEVVRLPADIAILMCDPEWKIKTGVEIFVLIHQPHEDFSALLGRWRQTQIWLNQGYEWIMPKRHQHLLSEGADDIHPLFVIFPETPERIRRGLRGACLPYVMQTVYALDEGEWLDDALEASTDDLLLDDSFINTDDALD
ncbi:hypothetical protein HJG54_02790 [Leptolyngbya sp. NK1-12]|uniref:Type IV pilin PilA n=1 Tax=Leptolyngbya sp. NK1-12 TaxID=2547451 RepID=A0AA97AED3_9CYAN|nr:hypothetical protein [Leptolyngbya sp. NK1-12]MBF2051503.1 hypothetical protein [Elainella sp. C42_A2020_010]RNJ65698.1 MAG: hypothetical protein EDM05_29870 [Leptolyngbya sp. IPPAS B-1204]WNZ21900.1 hypothetical protein HJG54_02790 [Leptolyngbya sp. NK1-12]